MLELAAHACRFTLATLFIFAGTTKLSHLDDFERVVNSYGFAPRSLTRILALLLPPLELAAGVALAIGIWVAPVAALLLSMLCVFTLAVVGSLVRGDELDCGCFGGVGVSTRITWRTVLRNLVLAAMAAFVFVTPARSLALWPGWGPSDPRAVPSDQVVAMLLVSGVAVCLSLLVGEAWTVTRRANALSVNKGAR